VIRRQSQYKMWKVRRGLFAANPNCHWCGTATIMSGNKYDPNRATVDHIKPRRECRSQEEYDESDNHVLSCRECNLLRDQVDLALMKHQREQQAALDRLKAPTRRVMVRTRCR